MTTKLAVEIPIMPSPFLLPRIRLTNPPRSPKGARAVTRIQSAAVSVKGEAFAEPGRRTALEQCGHSKGSPCVSRPQKGQNRVSGGVVTCGTRSWSPAGGPTASSPGSSSLNSTDVEPVGSASDGMTISLPHFRHLPTRPALSSGTSKMAPHWQEKRIVISNETLLNPATAIRHTGSARLEAARRDVQPAYQQQRYLASRMNGVVLLIIWVLEEPHRRRSTRERIKNRDKRDPALHTSSRDSTLFMDDMSV
jgi:hypothetical protein